MRESKDNEEDENPPQVLEVTTTKQEETEKENDEFDLDKTIADALPENVQKGSTDEDKSHALDTTSEHSELSKESESYGLKALITYKMKKVRNTWTQIKNLLTY